MKYIFLSSWDSEINHIQNCFLKKEFGDEHDDLITPIGSPRPSSLHDISSMRRKRARRSDSWLTFCNNYKKHVLWCFFQKENKTIKEKKPNQQNKSITRFKMENLTAKSEKQTV